MIKLKELVKEIMNELGLTTDDLKKWNKIMRGGYKVKNSVHSDDTPEYGKTGFGYGGPSATVYGKSAPDRPYRSDKKAAGAQRVAIKPEI